jgi:uncharacterized protein
MTNISKKIVITGVNSGLGLSLTKMCLNSGFYVTGVVRSLDAVSLDLSRLCCSQLTLLSADLSQEQDVQALIHQLQKEAYDVMVWNAGIARVTSTQAETYDQMEQTLKTNLHAPLQLTRALLPHILQHQTKIVFVSSLSAHIPGKQFASYAASKAGVSQYALSLRREHPTLPILCIEPGPVDTPIHQKAGNRNAPTKRFKSQEDYARRMYEAIMTKTGVHTLAWDWRCIRTLMRVTQ